MPIPGERRRSRLRLTVAEVTRSNADAPVLHFPLLVMGLAGGAAAAVVGWLLVTGLVMLAWFTAMAMPLPRVLGFAGQLWLAAHGAGATVGEVPVTLAPLGLTVLLVVLARSMVALALRATPPDVLDGWGAVRAWGLAAGGYSVVGAVIALTAGAATRIGWAMLGGLVVGALGAGWALASRLRRILPLPGRLAGLPRAIAAGAAAMTLMAAAVFMLALIIGSERVSRIENSLAPDGFGAWLLVGFQLLFLPNLLAWTASWMLGAGFSVGAGSLVSPMLTTVGLLPAIPALGAVPEPGGGNQWSYAWLLSGLLAGAAAGWVGSSAKADGTLVRALARGATSGLATAVLIVLVGALSRGDLGTGRLVGLGPVMINLIWLAPLPMILGGALAGLARWFVKARRLPPSGSIAADDTTELFEVPTEVLEQPTVVLGRRD